MAPFSLWTMVSCFIWLTLISLTIILVLPQSRWLIGNASSIAAHSAILSNSHFAQAALQETGHCDERRLRKRLEGVMFRAEAFGGKTQIRVWDKSFSNEAGIEMTAPKRRGWVPLAARFPAVTFTVLLPVLAIAALQLLHIASESRQGLVDLDDSSLLPLPHIIQMASTLSAFLVATMFNNLEFTIGALAPFSCLCLDMALAERSITFHPLSSWSFTVIYRSIRLRHFGVAAAYLASTIGAFLSVSVSGLWIPTEQLIPHQRSSMALSEGWTQNWLNNSSNDAGAAMRLNIIRHQGDAVSSLISGEFVLPRVTLDKANAAEMENNRPPQSYTYTIPVLRPTLECTVVPQHDISAILEKREPEIRAMVIGSPVITINTTTINVTTALQPGCIKVSPDLSTFAYQTTFSGDWIGSYQDFQTSHTGNSLVPCPSVSMIFGSFDVRSDSQLALSGKVNTKGITALMCSQGIEMIWANVTYQGDPELGIISPDNPPLLIERKATRWRNGSDGPAGLSYQTGGFTNQYFTGFSSGVQTFDEPLIDGFFDHVLSLPGAARREDLQGPANTKRLTEAVVKNYKEYMAQVINLNFRPNNTNLGISERGHASSSPTGVGYVGGTSTQMVRRLKIHETSKTILQVLLGTMLALGLIAFRLVRLRGILPRAPYTIGSVMGLLAGSRLCGRDIIILPENLGAMDDRELKAAFAGRVFSMGWWSWDGDGVGSSSGQVDVVGEEDDDVRRGRFGIDIGRASVLGFANQRGGVRKRKTSEGDKEKDDNDPFS